MDKASEAILALKPVTFRYKEEVEPNGAIQFGLVAEGVAEVDPDLVILDKGGKPESVRYETINAMLLNEFLKEHKKGRGTTNDDPATEVRGRKTRRRGKRTQEKRGGFSLHNSKSRHSKLKKSVPMFRCVNRLQGSSQQSVNSSVETLKNWSL